MLRLKFLAIPLAFCALLAGQPEAFAFQIAVSPMRFEVPLGPKPVRRSMKVVNHGKTPIEVGISVGHWDLDEENNVRNIAPTAQSLDQWIVASPLRMKIPAGKSRTLRFSIRPYTKPRIGEHRAMIYLDQNGSGVKSIKGVSFKFRIGVPVYANVGKPVRTGNISGVVVKPSKLGFNIKNAGKFNVRFAGNFGIWRSGKFPGSGAAAQLLKQAGTAKNFKKPKGTTRAGVLPTTPVLPGYRRTIPLALKTGLKPGNYKVHLAGKLGDRSLNKTYSFQVQ